MKRLSFLAAIALMITTLHAADFASMSTDELLDMRGTLTTTQERQELHNELKNREESMTREQLKRFNTYPPENRVRKYQNQGQGMGRGQGSGMGQGRGSN